VLALDFLLVSLVGMDWLMSFMGKASPRSVITFIFDVVKKKPLYLVVLSDVWSQNF
jgi:hypothetical protein